MSYNQCRLCTNHTQANLIKYGVRHYAHGICGIQKWGVKFLDKLHPWQIGQLPYFALRDAGLLDEARKRSGTDKDSDCSWLPEKGAGLDRMTERLKAKEVKN